MAGPALPLSAIARAITGTRWNGPLFFGLTNHRRCGLRKWPASSAARSTQQSSEEGLEQDSLHAQRESCEAYIGSQKPEGLVLVCDQYDDGGISGATLEGPRMKRLLADIEKG